MKLKSAAERAGGWHVRARTRCLPESRPISRSPNDRLATLDFYFLGGSGKVRVHTQPHTTPRSLPSLPPHPYNHDLM